MSRTHREAPKLVPHRTADAQQIVGSQRRAANPIEGADYSVHSTRTWPIASRKHNAASGTSPKSARTAAA